MHRIARVAQKHARGHTYFEYGEPMLGDPAHLWALPLECMTDTERQDFEGVNGEGSLAPWPQVGSRMMTRLITGDDMTGQWIVVQEV
jgi:hypothetical protein